MPQATKKAKVGRSGGSQLKPSDFVHLHVHTHHSLLDGLQKIPEMVSKVKALGMEAVAITDHGTLSGAIEFYKAAKSEGIKPIVGIESYVAVRSHLDKDPAIDRNRFHLVLLAMDETGYQNLMRLSSIANLDGYYYRPRIDHQLLEKYHQGIIVLSGCLNGEVASHLKEENYQRAEETAGFYRSVFQDRFYIELQDHQHLHQEQQIVNDRLIGLAAKMKLEMVITKDAHYLTNADQDAHEALLCIQTGTYLSDPNRMSLKDFDLALSDPREIFTRWEKHRQALINTRLIADRCNLEIPLGGIRIPKFTVPEGESEDSYLRRLVLRGLAWRYKGLDREKANRLSDADIKKIVPTEIFTRTEYELQTIKQMGLCGYFLIVQDFINWGKNQGIVFGPGRGSAAGSIVSYATNITDLDPLKYDLLFERFLNPDRISMPDIDIDIEDDRRDEVIRYCIEKYGQDKVAHIVTFGTMAARNAIRDVSRVLEVPYADADRMAKMVPPPVQGRHTPLSESVLNVAELRNEYQSSASARKVLDLAIRLEGTIRSHGVHAAGVVISPDEVVTHSPLEMAQKGVVTTQYPMGPIEDLGLVKMDFLGLSNLTIIKNALRIIRKVYEKPIDISALPLDDKPTFDLLARGDTTGVFQLESGGMKRLLKNLKPTTFEDIIATVAMFRPGPMQFIDSFVARKHGKEPIDYPHKSMEAALKNTYGKLIYQEQIIQIAKDMCGFTGGQADTLRKAVGKKIPELMAKLKTDFIKGGVAHSGADETFLRGFWHQLEDFASYCFNKSHAASYAMISYQTAYLKAHFPDAFMAALMTSDFDDIDRLAIEIDECQRMGLAVLPPDINESFLEFAVVPGTQTIRFGMVAIKNVGQGIADEIQEERKTNGPFSSLENFLSRINSQALNKKTLESLIKAGAFDAFHPRSALIDNLEEISAFNIRKNKQQHSDQMDMFGDETNGSDVTERLEMKAPASPLEENQILKWERELLGLYLSEHPLERYQSYLMEHATPISSLSLGMDGKKATIGGVVTAVKEINTKNGSKMAFVTVEDTGGSLEVIVFPGLYLKNKEIWHVDSLLMIKGRFNTKDNKGNETEELKLLADEALSVPEAEARTAPQEGTEASADNPKPPVSEKKPVDGEKLYVLVRQPEDNQQVLGEIKQILSKHGGPSQVILVLGEKSKNAIKLPFGVTISAKLTEELVKLLDEAAVKIK